VTCICPHCGYSLAADAIIALDGFEIDPRGKVAWQGARLALTGQQAEILHVIAAGEGRPVKIEIISERLGHDGNSDIVHVQVCRLRRNLREAGAPNVIKSTGARSFFWNTPDQ
jgi:DNA-binding response OmpR family regulator